MVSQIEGLPVFKAVIDEDGQGMERISLVDLPAVESNFLAFDKQAKPMLFAVQDEERRIVRGVVARADYPIYRRNADGYEYYIVFTADTIRAMAEKYLAEGRANAVNLMHEQGYELTGVKMLQWYIKDTEAGIAPAGFDDIADGSLFAEFHIEDDAVWDAVKDGTYKGFSLEGYFGLEPIRANQIKRNMTKIERLKAKLLKFLTEDEDFQLRSMTTDRGILQWDGEDDLKVGDEVFIEDNGELTPAADGEYITTEGTTIVVAEGKVTEIREVEEEPAQEEEPEPAPQEVEEKEQTPFQKIAQAFQESYEERWAKIADAIADTGILDFYIEEAGDEYAVIYAYTEEGGKYLRYDLTWSEDGEVTLGEPFEVLKRFITPAQADELENLRSEVAELKARSAAKPAHEEYKETDKKVSSYERISKLLK